MTKTTTLLRRAGLTLATLTVALLATAVVAGHASAAEVTQLADTWNPIGDVTPDFSLFGPSVGQTWRRFIAAIWAACLAACAMWMIIAGAKWSAANRRGFAAQQVDAKSSFMDAAVGFGVCAGASVVVGGVIFALGF
ncbi:hypothetical protein [Gordonia humi]|uniref:Uncharacterized protein n=1 Tax=Gordonia humi TaxID=686429 RepID=A0A840F5Z5_9ACTN|nr:hypothetical protein [Gordonia humi]MBB4138084.1 hypothetical protein [Gordonia humi]